MPSRRSLPFALALLFARVASAQPPPASPLAILNVPVSQPLVGQTGALGLSTGFEPGGRLPIDLLGTISGWNRVEFGWAMPLRVGLDRVEVDPFRATGKFVLVPRREGARGLGAALIVGTHLPLHDFDVVRFGVDLGVVVDVQLARNILLAGYAAIGGSARYRLEDPAFQSFTSGIGVEVTITPQVAFLADLWGRIDVPGGPVIMAETSAGIRAHIGPVFLIGSVGISLIEPSLLARLTVPVGAGDGMVRPEERDDVEPPDDMCFETRCTPQQRAAVRRVLLPRIEEMRKRLLALAVLLRARFPARTAAADTREIVRLRIDNDLSIADDAERKRELSIRFLLAVFAQSDIAIDRAMAEQILDDTQWRVQVDRTIDESSVDYFTYDMPHLGAAYADRLRWNAERLKDAMAALRAADAGTTEILLDIARGHANGLIGVTNGILDLPLAPLNLARFMMGREAIRGLGRIPHLGYKSEWGHEFGGAVEVGVMLGTMSKPGGAIFEEIGGALAPAFVRLEELSTLAWNGIPVGRFLQSFLPRWMRGSLFAVKAHAAADADEIVYALVTGRVRMPDGSYQPLTQDTFDALVLALVQNVGTMYATMKAEEGASGEAGRFRTGRLGEELVRRILVREGFKEVLPIQNGSGHGIDLVIDYTDGLPLFIEIKTSVKEKAPGLSEAQRDFEKFVRSRLEDAIRPDGPWANAPPAVKAEARRLLQLIRKNPLALRGAIVEITNIDAPVPAVRVHKW